MKNLSTILFLFVFVISCDTPLKTEDQKVIGATSQKGMVTSAHPLASAIGVEILKKGGNAYDAAVSVFFALNVSYPRAGNIGGGGFALVRTKEGEFNSLDFREKAPKKAHRDMYLDQEGNVIPGISLFGHLAVGVPGSVDGMVQLHQKYGKLPWDLLIAPAIDLAEKGVVLTAREASNFNKYQEDFLRENGRMVSISHPEKLWEEGDTVNYPLLAETFKRIQVEGRAGFYNGKTAELLIREMQNHGGLITQEDLDAYQSQWRKPIEVGYKQNYQIISMPPPSSGGVAIAQLMQGAEDFDLKSKKHNHPDYLHLLVELERRAYADRATFLGDPDFIDIPVDSLIDDDYVDQRNESISLKYKTDSKVIKPGEVEVIESFETTHFSIVDPEGNAVAITTTLNGFFGCKVEVEGAGFFLNNEMDDFSAKVGVPNQFGLIGGEANAIAPEKRMLSSMSPTMVEKNGELMMVLGTPGGSTIITSVFQTMLNVIEFDMTIQEAINEEKIHSQWLPDVVYLEKGRFSPETKEKLQLLGHRLDSVNALGRLDCILIHPDGTIEGASDPLRSDGQALGL